MFRLKIIYASTVICQFLTGLWIKDTFGIYPRHTRISSCSACVYRVPTGNGVTCTWLPILRALVAVVAVAVAIAMLLLASSGPGPLAFAASRHGRRTTTWMGKISKIAILTKFLHLSAELVACSQLLLLLLAIIYSFWCIQFIMQMYIESC